MNLLARSISSAIREGTQRLHEAAIAEPRREAGSLLAHVLVRDRLEALAAKLELRREPIYRWTNPTRVGGQVGDVFVWTSKGRPEVVGSFYKWYAPFTHRTNEFVSMATG